MSLLNRIKAAGAVFRNPGNFRLQYAGAKQSPNRHKPNTGLQSARFDINTMARQAIVTISRDLERNDALVNRFLDLCEQYVVGPYGLRIRAATSNEGFNELANQEFELFANNPDLSSRMTMAEIEALVERTVNVDGEIFIYPTESPTSGFPRIQLIEGHRVKTPPGKGPNENIYDGVEIDPETGRPVKYYVQVEKSGYYQPLEFVPIPADELFHIFEPSRAGQLRGLPIFYPVINDLIDLQELQGYEMLAAKDAASLSRVVETPTGEIEEDSGIGSSLRRQSQDGSSDTKSDQEYYKDVDGGRWIALKAGHQLKEFSSNRPSVAVQQFWDYVSARAMAGAGLPVEIILMRSLQGTMTRAALDMANSWFRGRSSLLASKMGRVYQYVIQHARERGALSNAPDDWRRFRYTPPRSINVDVGRNSAALINEWKAGFRTLDNIASEHGWDWRELIDQKAKEMAYAAKKAKENELDRSELIQLSPNEIARRPEGGSE